jgi:hypothetical protein
MKTKSNRRKLILLISLLLLTIFFSVIFVYLNDAYPANTQALAAMRSDTSVEFETSSESWLVFRPVSTIAERGIIFYPGGKVQAKAYASLAHQLAAAGYLTVIVPMPFNLAVFNPKAGIAVPRAFPKIPKWTVAGHSLGGVMVAQLIGENPSIDSLVLIASYLNPPQDFRNTPNLSVLLLTASNDLVLAKENFDKGMILLPENHHLVEIIGGNHGQFGSYGQQNGDGVATLSPQEQISQSVTAISDFLQELP